MKLPTRESRRVCNTSKCNIYVILRSVASTCTLYFVGSCFRILALSTVCVRPVGDNPSINMYFGKATVSPVR